MHKHTFRVKATFHKGEGGVILFSKEKILFSDCRIIRPAVVKMTDKMNDQHLMLSVHAK